MRLRKSVLTGLGITRVRRGKGFSYQGPDGAPLSDDTAVAREDNESHGLATLLCEHVTVRRGAVAFDFPAKSGVRRTLEIEAPAVAKATRTLIQRVHRS